MKKNIGSVLGLEKYRFRIGFIPHTVGRGRSGGGWKGELGAGWAFGHHGA